MQRQGEYTMVSSKLPSVVLVCKQGTDDDEVVNVDDDLVAKMSGGDVDVKPYLYSRNTIGHGNHNSNAQRPKHGKMVGVDSG